MKPCCKRVVLGFCVLFIAGTTAFGQKVSRAGLVLDFPNVDLPVRDASGQHNNATSVSALTVSNSASLVSMQQSGQLTYAAWIQPNSIPNEFPVLLSKGGNEAPAAYGGYEFALNVNGDRDLLFLSGAFAVYSGPGLINNHVGEWIHVAFTIDTTAQTAQFYVNGQPVSSVIGAGSFSDVNFNLPNNLYVGRPDPGANGNRSSFDGQMRQVLLFNRVLSAQEIQTLAATPAPQVSAVKK